ncbi:hypothetical protein EDB87DRAFT_1576377 [Lactarius vividus]|nr:hypothetical protein EDB87DRAFT_1576377 [Lactarius vividus]
MYHAWKCIFSEFVLFAVQAYCLGQMKNAVSLESVLTTRTSRKTRWTDMSAHRVGLGRRSNTSGPTPLSDLPLPPLASFWGTATQSSTKESRDKLLDQRLPLLERYRATFVQRNIGTPAAVETLAASFSDDRALLK